MLQAIHVEIDAEGRVHPLAPAERIPPGRALVVVLGDERNEAALLAEQALADDWLRPEEDDAWAHLQQPK